VVAQHRTEQLAGSSIEAAILTTAEPQAATWRPLPDGEIRELLAKR
jgi:hypothetical protein